MQHIFVEFQKYNHVMVILLPLNGVQQGVEPPCDSLQLTNYSILFISSCRNPFFDHLRDYSLYNNGENIGSCIYHTYKSQ